MRAEYLHQLIRILGLMVLFSFLFPIIKIGGFGLKPDLLVLGPLFMLVLLQDNKLRRRPLFTRIFGISFLVFISMLISDTLGNIDYGNAKGVYFPTEYVNFVTKVCVMYVFYVIGVYNIMSEKLFLNSITIVFMVALVFGLSQILGISFVTSLTEMYASTENQVLKIAGESGRIFSTTGNVLTWAGWSGFILIYSLILYKQTLVKWSMLVLSSANLLFTSSRGALIAVLVSLLIYLFYRSYKARKVYKVFKYLILFFGLFLIIGWLALYFFEERVLFFVERFYFLDEAIFESGRNTQFQNIGGLFSRDKWNYILGIGKPVVDSVGLMEVEFVFILFSYGIVGVVLHYLFVYITIFEATKSHNRYSYIVVIGIVFYLIYSFGYFFLREIYSGLLFWSIIGYFLSRIRYEK